MIKARSLVTTRFERTCSNGDNHKYLTLETDRRKLTSISGTTYDKVFPEPVGAETR